MIRVVGSAPNVLLFSSELNKEVIELSHMLGSAIWPVREGNTVADPFLDLRIDTPILVPPEGLAVLSKRETLVTFGDQGARRL